MATQPASQQPSSPKLLSIDPALQAVFDSMATFMGTGIVNMTCTRSVTGTGINQTCNLVDADGNTAQTTVFAAGAKITITPMSANLGPGGTQQFTAAATNADGSPVAAPVFAWSIQPGGLGKIDAASGLYNAPALISANSMDSVKCSLQGTPTYTTISVSLHP